jgi:hypothetical protein
MPDRRLRCDDLHEDFRTDAMGREPVRGPACSAFAIVKAGSCDRPESTDRVVLGRSGPGEHNLYSQEPSPRLSVERGSCSRSCASVEGWPSCA